MVDGPDPAFVADATEPVSRLGPDGRQSGVTASAMVLADLLINHDHKRRCQGREYLCTCHYDATVLAAARELDAALTRPRNIAEAPHVIPSSYMRVSGDALPEALGFLRQIGGFLRSVAMEAAAYRVEFQHPEYEACETEMLCIRERGTFKVCLRVLGPAQAIEARRAATGNTDAVEDESAVGSADAPTPHQDSSREEHRG